MHSIIWNMTISLLLFSAMPAFAQSDPGEAGISDEEYGIYKVVLADLGYSSALDGRSSGVDGLTLAGTWDEADIKIPAGGVRLDQILKDLNAKSHKEYPLSGPFLQETNRDSENSRAGRKKVTFSRAGFDGEKRHALLVVGTTFYYPEDVMNEGDYVLLEKKDGKWAVVKTASAWPMHLGKIH